MALDKLTIINNGGLSTTSDYRVGVLTATKFVGPIEGVITSTDATFTGNVSIAGTLTYEDVTNIDSVGLITARDGIDCNADLDVDGHTNLDNVSIAGVSTFSGTVNTASIVATGIDLNGDIDVDGHTNLDNVSIAGVSTFAGNIILGNSIVHDGDTDTKIVFTDNTIDFQTAGASRIHVSSHVKLPDNAQIQLGNAGVNDFILLHDGTDNIINCGNNGDLLLRSATHKLQDLNADNMIVGNTGGSVELYHNNTKRLETSSVGVSIPQDLDVDGHTNLDNVSIAGVSTNASTTYFDNQVYWRNSGTNKMFTLSNNAGMNWQDNVKAEFGNSGDLKIYNASSENHIYGSTSQPIIFSTNTDERLRITSGGQVLIGTTDAGHSSADDLTINNSGNGGITIRTGTTSNGAIFFADSTSGTARYDGFVQYNHGSSPYMMFGTAGDERVRITNGGNLKLPDNAKIELGGGQAGSGDLEIYYDGTDGFINQKNNALKIQHNGTLKSYFGSNTLNLQDDYKLGLGTGNDLTLWHNQSHSIIKNTTGRLYVLSDDLWFKNQGDNSSLARFLNGDSVILYYAGNPKLQTLPTGITVTGEVAATQDYPNFRPTLDFNFAAEKKLDPRITYTRTGPASFVNEFGKVVLVGGNVPRFDHDPTTGECKGLLFEESRTNKVNYSESLATGWSLNNSATRYKNDVVAPDGVLYTNTSTGGSGVWEVVETSSSTTHLVYQQLSGGDSPNSTACTISAFAKPGLNRTHFVLTEGNTLSATAIFDVANGTVTSTVGTGSPTAKIEGPFFNGWYRCSLTYTTASTQNYINIQLGVAQNGTTVSYAGDGSSSIAVWGVQFEEGIFPTSYIPTEGTTVTRGQDFLVMTGTDVDDIFNPNEGTMFYEASVTDLTNANQPIVTFRNSLNTGEEFFAMGHATGGSAGYVRVWAKNSAGTNVHITTHGTALVADTPYKHAFGYAYNNYSDVFTQGTTSSQLNTTSGNHAMMATGVIDELRFGAYYTNLTNKAYSLESGHIKRFSYWPQRITNSQLKTYIS